MTYKYKDHKLDYEKILSIINNQMNYPEEALGVTKEQLRYRKEWIEELLAKAQV